MSDGKIDPATSQSGLVHERHQESPSKRWILLEANRIVLAGLFSILIFVIVTAIGAIGYIPVTDPGTATTLVAAIVGGMLPFITIVLAINQLVLSHELGWPGNPPRGSRGWFPFERLSKR